MAYSISKVQPGDEAVLGFIQSESWKAAFKGILAPEELEKRTEINRVVQMYKRTLKSYAQRGYLMRVDGKPHCIAWWDAAREEDMPGYAELICIHSLPGQWRQGYGSRMMEKVLEDIHSAGYEKVMLWVFEENLRARKFYEKHGFAPNGKQKEGFGAMEMCYERML